MWLTDLANIIRAEGCSVTEEPGWATRGHGSLTAVRTIVIHHTAGAANGDYPSLTVVRDGRYDLPGPLAQLGVGRSGQVYVIAAGLAYHAGAVRLPNYDNAHSIGIEVESVGDGTPWPDAQVRATAKTTAALCVHYGVPVSEVLGHKEVCAPVGRKVDPRGIPGDMPAFRQMVLRFINGEESDDMAVEDVERMLWKGGNVPGSVAEDTLIARVRDLESMVWAGGPVAGAVADHTLIADVRTIKTELEEIKALLQSMV